MLELDTAADCLNVLRRAGSQKQRSLFYRDIRPYLLAEEVSFKCDGVCKIIIFEIMCRAQRIDSIFNYHVILISSGFS